jgi:S1-C subfamily serine protease
MKLSCPALVTVLSAAAIILVGCFARDTTVESPAYSPSVSVNAPALEKSYVGVVAKVLPSVVQITTNGSLGSGVVFDGKGDIVTNAHVAGQETSSRFAWLRARR